MKCRVIAGIYIAAAMIALGAAPAVDSVELESQSSVASEVPAFVAYYWKARPGREREYADYIRTVAEPIDESARRAGVFEEIRTVTPVVSADTAAPDWTHLRIFRVKNLAAVATLSAGLDAATARVVPDEAQRKANTARSAQLRDLVRREVWTELR